MKDECFEEFKKSIKYALEASIQKRINYMLKEIEASYGLRENPGWDYLQFFALKENLALVLEMLNLFLDCLQQYDELSNLFFELSHISKIKFSTYFNFKLEILSDNWDVFNPLLMNYSKLNYRILIYNDKISEFMFLQYVLARKLYLLKKLDMDFEAIERFKYFIKEINLLMDSKSKYFSIQMDEDEERNQIYYKIFCHVWKYQVSNGLAQIYKNNLVQANAYKITALTNNISYLKNLAKYHLQKIGALIFDLEENFFKFDSIENSRNLLVSSLKNEMRDKEKYIFRRQLDFEKFYSKFTVIHDKELYLSLKSIESYFGLLYKCYNEIKSIYLLNYNRRLSFNIQIEAFRLAVKSKTVSQIPKELSDLSLKFLKNWNDLELNVKINYCLFLYFLQNNKTFVKFMLSLLTSKKLFAKDATLIFQAFIENIEKNNEKCIILKKSEAFLLDDISISQINDCEAEIKLKILSKIVIDSLPCKIKIVLEEKGSGSVKKICLGVFNLKFETNEIEKKIEIDAFGLFKIKEIRIKFSKIKISLPDYDENLIIFQVAFLNKNLFSYNQKNLKLGVLTIKDLVTFEPLDTLDVFNENCNRYLLEISDPRFVFSSLNITITAKKHEFFSINEIVIFFKNEENPNVCSLVSYEENEKKCFKLQDIEKLEHVNENISKIFAILTIDPNDSNINAKEEFEIYFEFFKNEHLTCILKEVYELNFEKIFELKFNHYSNPVLSFSNIQIKNLCFYSFKMQSFILDNKNSQELGNKILNPLEIMGIILKNQNLSINSGYFQFKLLYNEENLRIALEKTTENNPFFVKFFWKTIEEYKNRNLKWNLPPKFILELAKTTKLSFLFEISVETSLFLYIGLPLKIRFSIKKNSTENFENYNDYDYFLALEKQSNNWLVAGKIQQKIPIIQEEKSEILEFTLLPLVVGYVQLPKFQILKVKNDLAPLISNMKEDEAENNEKQLKQALKNSEILVKYINGNHVLIKNMEKTKADYAVLV